jgi:hypothetical protein
VVTHNQFRGGTITTTLCIFVKTPLPGVVKTRLTPPLSAAEAAGLAAAFFEDTLAAATAGEWARVVVACDGDPVPLGLSTDIPIWTQGAGDLGERIERVLSRALECSDAAIAIGTDSPGLPRPFLDSAQQLLGEHDAVVGPCEDGGFYLLGLRRCPAGLLRGLPWSIATTREHTKERLRFAGLRVAETELWFDVDLPTDLNRLAELLRAECICAPRTARLLTELALIGRLP